ncbi:MAG: UvrD-helicase domain-containing protein [Candidatus Poribacteria bacterium]|nr:UvrD-helicase domain-containing protein [Candidatus Poribacteria bacterium]
MGDPATRSQALLFEDTGFGRALRNFPGSAKRLIGSRLNLVRPPDVGGQLVDWITGDDKSDWFTEEQRQFVRLGRDVAQWSYDIATRNPYDVQDYQKYFAHDVQETRYPVLSQAGAHYDDILPWSPWAGYQGFGGLARQIEEEPAEFLFDVGLSALGGVGSLSAAPRRLSRLQRASQRFGLERQLADATVQIQTLGQRQWRRLGRREVLEEGMGLRTGSGDILTASHVITGSLGEGAPGPLDVRRVDVTTLLGNRVTSPGVRGILPEADIANLAIPDIPGAALSLENLDLPEGVLPRLTDDATGASMGLTARVGQPGQSGAAFETETGELGLYLGTLGDRGTFATQQTLLDFQRGLGRGVTPFSQLDAFSAVDALGSRGLHYRADRFGGFGDGGFALHGASSRWYPVQTPLNVDYMDPRSVMETPSGRQAGVTLYSGDVRRAILDLAEPRRPEAYRADLLSEVERIITRDRIPEAFRQTKYDGVFGVPSSPNREAWRGYNFADIIGRHVASELDIPFLENLAIRTRSTARSASFVGNQAARVENLRGAFGFMDPEFIRGKRFLVTDDILTTGATFDAVRRAALQAGAAGVDSLALSTTLLGLKIPQKMSQFEDVVSAVTSPSYQLTDLQQIASQHVEGPGIISAIPGSGKTQTLRENLRFLTQEQGVGSQDILSVAFSRAAADELRDRLLDIGDFPVRTMHSMAYEIVQNYPERLGFETAPRIDPELTQKRFRAIVRDRETPGLELDHRRGEALRLGRAAETPEEFAAAYQLYKGERGIATFQDYLRLGTEILETQTDVRQLYQARYPFQRIDEFQDIPLQGRQFLEQLSPNILGVGDLNQGIYGFAGATGDAMRDFARHAQVYPLTENFRSGQNLVDFSERFIGLNPSLIDRPPARAARPGGTVDIRQATPETIFDELRQGIEGLDPSSYAILTRTNREIAKLQQVFGDALEGVNVGTIHSAKGREWENVFLPMETIPVTYGDGIENVYRRNRARMTPEDIEAERRVAYVGATRARENLHILGSGDIFEELQGVQLHGRSGGLREVNYGFGDNVIDQSSLTDINKRVRELGYHFRATHRAEQTDIQESLDWGQTLEINQRLRDHWVESYRGEESALFPLSAYLEHQDEIDYNLLSHSRVGESPWEPGMAGVFRQGVYASPDLEMLLKHAFWNKDPRYHMGGEDLRLVAGETLAQGESALFPDNAFVIPGEVLIRPDAVTSLGTYDDLLDLRTGDPFTGTSMEASNIMQHLGMGGLQLHGRVAVTGGRDFRNRKVVYDALDTLHDRDPITALYHGGAMGADSLASEWAKSRGVPQTSVLPQWHRYGKAAGPIRNREILERYQPDTLLAFRGGRGTANMVRQARKRGIEVLGAEQDVLRLHRGSAFLPLGVASELMGDSESKTSPMFDDWDFQHGLPGLGQNQFAGVGVGIGADFSTPSSLGDAYAAPQYRYGASLGTGLGYEIEHFPDRLARSYLKDGFEGVKETTIGYPIEVLKGQGMRVARNYASDAIKNLFRPETQKIDMGLQHYLGEGLTEFLGTGAGAWAGAAALAVGTAYIGERSLDANYEEVVPTAAMRVDSFYKKFGPSQQGQETYETSPRSDAGMDIDSDLLSGLVKGIVADILSEGAAALGDQFVTQVGRAIKVQEERGIL